MAKRKRLDGAIAREVHPLVQEITGAIIKRMRVLGLTRQQLAKKVGKKSASVLYGWRNGSRQSPELLALQPWLTGVGLTLVASDGTGTPVQCRRLHVTSEIEKDILGWVRALPTEEDKAELRRIVRDFYLTRTSGSRPLEPAQDE